MTTSPSTDSDTTAVEQLDAVVLGAGVAGLYQLHQLREQGLNVRAFDAAGDVGGTWWWNRYPGARFDSEAYIYQYLFDEKLYTDWSWSEKFPGQPEIERWLHYVTDRLDLRRDITFNTKITSAHYDEDRGRWTVRTDAGHVIDTQFFVSCAGMLSAPLTDQFEGQDSFAGQLVYTSSYPADGLDVTGKRVGVVGIGATGIQVIQTIAPDVGHLTVFARTPQYVLPMKNPSYGPAEQAAYKARFAELKATIPHTFTGFEYDFEHAWADCTPEQRLEILENTYQDGSLKLWLAGFGEMFFSEEVSEEISEFVRDKMRERLRDQHLIDVLVPTDYGFGTHRVPLENGYLEVYHQHNVDLIGVQDNPIARILPGGIELTDGAVVELDVIILATGFDAGTGALTRIDIRGRDGRSLAEEWGRDIRTTMGLAKHGYPNLLTTAVPLAPSAALCNMTTCLQQQTEWITRAIRDLRVEGKSTIEPTERGEEAWVAHHEETAGATIVVNTTSWYLGSNVPGKPRRLLSYIGGVGTYRQHCEKEAADGYPAFERR
ncbi:MULTISPECIES: flavin-containing monooxygenase [Pseudonocardia]|uniref:Phenylacetone monooxygenase n=2 Tax=Pseudonocardia TaxID=1847 RepID=A0A1Y2MTD5_PSEAH|nr:MULTISPECIES: NAD(P)/FAD-dependent oxidoreductase [Pseudonocardia]OSY38462.1 Phenylacetone monooxygenase [Pseudonocardia autotrophica]TDN77095.1 cyclohexanone monooxygenase/acetone monooxygenase [Pseudonocardia autotrophica]BBG01101.1 cyclohexanone monooxygenase [Pseudonocardia autotrophica]GEC28794.1 cyclohexanone monooxygenase [Pseudonocardia saturnea]